MRASHLTGYRPRAFRRILLAAALCGIAATAHAQPEAAKAQPPRAAQAPSGQPPSGIPAEPDSARTDSARTAQPGAQASARPRLPKDKRTQLEGLFAALKVAPDDTSSKVIADRLEQIFSDSGSPAADLLMARASVAAEAKQYELAFALLDQVLTLEPDYVGALSKRATLHYLKDEYGAALADIREVLAREPRHFAMLYGFALILKEIGDEKRALTVLRNALEVNPRLEDAKEMEQQLSIAVEGRGI